METQSRVMKIVQLTLLSLIGIKMKKNGRKLLLTLPPKYDKLLLQPTKEKKVDYPIPASVTPMPETNATFVKELVEAGELKPLYDPKATIVVRKGYYYGTPSDSKFDLENADDISRTYWRLDALQETNNRNSRAQDKVKDYLVENYDEIGEEHATEIANILSIDLSKSVDVEFNVTIKATISIPVNKDVSDLSVYDFDVEISSNESDYDIEEFDVDIDSIDERY
jgi:hypothetical protein